MRHRAIATLLVFGLAPSLAGCGFGLGLAKEAERCGGLFNVGCSTEGPAANLDETQQDIASLRVRADKGDADAQERHGFLYANGNGLPEDNIQADMWFTLASNAGDKVAAQHLVDLEKGMTPKQIAEAKKRASEWKPSSS